MGRAEAACTPRIARVIHRSNDSSNALRRSRRNRHSRRSKQSLLFGEIGIDLPAGTTEVLIIANETADLILVATDLLSQAKHGPETPVVLITTPEELGKKIIKQFDRLLRPGRPLFLRLSSISK